MHHFGKLITIVQPEKEKEVLTIRFHHRIVHLHWYITSKHKSQLDFSICSNLFGPLWITIMIIIFTTIDLVCIRTTRTSHNEKGKWSVNFVSCMTKSFHWICNQRRCLLALRNRSLLKTTNIELIQCWSASFFYRKQINIRKFFL